MNVLLMTKETMSLQVIEDNLHLRLERFLRKNF